MTVVSLGAMLTGCSSDGSTSPTAPLLSTKGSLDGLLVNVQGTPQGNFGTLILMYPSGQHVGMTIAPDANGRFRFADLPAGEYQLRFQAS